MSNTKKVAAGIVRSDTPPPLSLIHALPDAVVGFSRALKVGFGNQAAQAFFRLSEKQLLEQSLIDLLGDGNAVFESVELAVRKNQTVTLHDVSIRQKPVGGVTVTTVERDSFYLMSIRQQSVQLSREWNEKTRYSLQSTEMVARMLAHEIRNPLAGIRGAAQLLGGSDLSDEDTELASLITRETTRIQQLVDKFNVFNDVPPDRNQPVNLHEVLDHVAKIVRAQYGADVVIEQNFDPSLPDIRGNFDSMVQAQLNLVKNAAEALPDRKGRISIRTYYDSAVGFHPERPEKLPLCVEIEDNGKGIAADSIDRIFQPYYTTKPDGQGLGLPIVLKIVDAHGGVIHVNSETGKTVFKINLPVPAAAPASPSSSPGRKG